MSKFASKLRKTEKKLVERGISIKSGRPTYWINTGNYLLNKLLSGKYRQGIAQGRISAVSGPSSAGKSFIIANIAREAQKQGIGLFVMDSENALDDGFMQALGVDTEHPDYLYRGISGISEATELVAEFIKTYREDKEEGKWLIILDSIDMLSTDSEIEQFEKGEQKGDQGQHAKQVKKMLKPWVNGISGLNISILCSKQVFQEQDPMLAKNPQTAWKFTESTKYAFSQILLVTKFMLKDENAKKIPGRSDTQYAGIRLKAYGLKTRFTKPFQSASIEVPYETGMDPYDGLLEMASVIGVVEKNGGWYYFGDAKFQAKNSGEYMEAILEKMVELESVFLEDQTEGVIVEATVGTDSISGKRKAKLMAVAASEDEQDEEDRIRRSKGLPVDDEEEVDETT